jgi:hypothetical protein
MKIWDNGVMSWKKTFWRDIYLILLFLSFRNSAEELFLPNSPKYFYYHFLNAFDISFFFIYLMECLRQFFLPLQIIFVFSAVHKIKIANTFLGKAIFVGRLITDFFGQSFFCLQIKTILHEKLLYGISAVCCLFFFYLPAYVIHYRYAFSDMTKK